MKIVNVTLKLLTPILLFQLIFSSSLCYSSEEKKNFEESSSEEVKPIVIYSQYKSVDQIFNEIQSELEKIKDNQGLEYSGEVQFRSGTTTAGEVVFLCLLADILLCKVPFVAMRGILVVITLASFLSFSVALAEDSVNGKKTLILHILSEREIKSALENNDSSVAELNKIQPVAEIRVIDLEDRDYRELIGKIEGLGATCLPEKY